jgi:hypothetical protein
MLSVLEGRRARFDTMERSELASSSSPKRPQYTPMLSRHSVGQACRRLLSSLIFQRSDKVGRAELGGWRAPSRVLVATSRQGIVLRAPAAGINRADWSAADKAGAIKRV